MLLMQFQGEVYTRYDSEPEPETSNQIMLQWPDKNVGLVCQPVSDSLASVFTGDESWGEVGSETLMKVSNILRLMLSTGSRQYSQGTGLQVRFALQSSPTRLMEKVRSNANTISARLGEHPDSNTHFQHGLGLRLCFCAVCSSLPCSRDAVGGRECACNVLWMGRENWQRGVEQESSGKRGFPLLSSDRLQLVPEKHIMHSQVEGRKEAGGTSFKGLVWAAGGGSKILKKKTFLWIQVFLASQNVLQRRLLSCPHLARQYKPTNKFNSSFDFAASSFCVLCPLCLESAAALAYGFTDPIWA